MEGERGERRNDSQIERETERERERERETETDKQRERSDRQPAKHTDRERH